MKNLRSYIVPSVLAVFALSGCGSDKSTTGTADNPNLPLVAFAQANSQDPWRQVFDKDIKQAADKHSSEFQFTEQEAGDDPKKQIDEIETLMVKKPKVLLVSPVTEASQKAIEDAHDAGAYVILLDRSIPGNKWDVYVGGDNYTIGKMAAEFMGKKLNGKGIILMIRGIADAIPTKERAGGFMDAMKQFPEISVIQGDDCGYQRAKAQTFMENFLQSKKPFDAVYAHNDEMAIGAYLAMSQANAPAKMIVGIDGCQKEVVKDIKDGKIAATFRYPQPGAPAIDIAADYLKGKKHPSNKVLLPTEMVTKDNAEKYLQEHPNLAD